MMMQVSIAKVEEISERVRSCSPRATYSATLFLSPLPSPISILSIHNSMLLMVSQMPFLYSPRQCSVAGTISSTMMADHPLMRKEAMMFFCKREERCWLMAFLLFMASLYLTII